MLSLIPALPLLGFLINACLGRRLPKTVSGGVACLAMLASFAVSVLSVLNVGTPWTEQTLYRWISSGDLQIALQFRLDHLSSLMILVVTGIGSLIHIYSTAYMHEETDGEYARYFSYLNLFAAFMLVLVLGSSFPVMFVGWEGVGLCSYLLIGFWFKKKSAGDAGKKAFIVNRIGDFGFLLGTLMIFANLGTLDFQGVAASVQGGWPVEHSMGTLTIATLLLFLGATGKSAQIPLYTWLPDAMEGPTPVSALIHAATMVTAGVFMVARLSPLFELAPTALAVVTLVGATTAFFAATVGLVQNDIKRVVAYSTCSQLGYMFVAMGVGAYSVGMFHLFTHAFFKALLFLGSGSVIHAMHHEQDIRKMGGLRDKLPVTYVCMVIGTLALTGFPLTAGYFSKDAIIEAAAAGHNPFAPYAFVMTVIAALLTSFYSWRLIFKTFHGRPADQHAYDHAHESPWVILIPLIFLAAGSILAGFPFKEMFAGHHVAEFFRESLKFGPDNHVLHDMHTLHWAIPYLPTVMMLIGFAIAWQFYIRRPDIPEGLAKQHDGLYQFLLNKWYFDELYDLIFVRPALWIGRVLWKGGDGRIIDGLGPDGVSARVLDVTRNVVRLQTGYLYHYAFAMLIGIAALITWFMFVGGGH